MSCARKSLSAKAGLWVAVACVLAVMALLASARSAPPRIAYILKTNATKVDIHFNSEANRTYILQGIYSLSCTNCSNHNVAPNKWTNLLTILASPATNHWIYRDSLTNKARFYRLRVTP